MSNKQLDTIATLHSPFSQKFGLPRQAGMIQAASAFVEMLAPYHLEEAVRGLENFSHLWLTFGFNQHEEDKWRPMVRPPRLGGNQKMGVFASRSPFRPNGLGLSAVALKAVHTTPKGVRLEIACPDILDGSPIYDIKPYLHYADSMSEALSGYAEQKPEIQLEVSYQPHCSELLAKLSRKDYGNLQQLITEVIAFDPRPAYKPELDPKTYTLRLYDLDICFEVAGTHAVVQDIRQL